MIIAGVDFTEFWNEPGIRLAVILVPCFLVYALFAYWGAVGKIVVYRNFNDVMLVGLLVVIPFSLIYIISYFQDEGGDMARLLLPTVVVLEAVVMLVILVRTWRDNRNPFKLLASLYVKLPTGILFFVHLISAFSSKTREDRRKSLLWTVLLLPLLYSLVCDKKTGFMAKAGQRGC